MAAVSLLEQAARSVEHVPWALLALGHSLSLAAGMRRAHGQYWLWSWLVGFLNGFGGGLTSALLIQDATVAAISLFANNKIAIIWTASWWGVNYCPGDLVARAHALAPLRAAALACRAVFRASIIVQRVDVSVAKWPGVIAAPLVLGTIAGSGGGLWTDLLNIGAGFRKGPSQISCPGFGLRSGFITALAYYLLAHVAQLLTPIEGKGLVISFFIAHNLAGMAAGRTLDWTAPLARLFHLVTNIPEPVAQAAGKAGSPAAAASPPALQLHADASQHRRAGKQEGEEAAELGPASVRRSSRRRAKRA